MWRIVGKKISSSRRKYGIMPAYYINLEALREEFNFPFAEN